jgi:AcrR family transcriptional regulator
VLSDDPRAALLDAAERLIALRGPEVPLRDIAAAAGQRNNSAVHYYFGSRAGLVDAIVERRMEWLDAVRLDLLAAHEAAGTGHEVRALVDMLVRPLVELAATGRGTHYARFLEVVRTQPALTDARLERVGRSAVRILTTRLAAALPDLTPTRRVCRVEAMAGAMFALIADREREIEQRAGLPEPAATDEIVEMLVGLLLAPAGRHA